MRLECFLPEAHALANQVGAYQACYRGVDVHNGTARKVQRAMGSQQTTAPDHMRNRDIGERQPDHHENQYRREADTLSQRAHNQPHGDAGE